MAFIELVLLPGCGLYRAGAAACMAVAFIELVLLPGCGFIELVLLPGCGLYRAGAVTWLWPL